MTLRDGNSTGNQLQSVNDKLREHHARISEFVTRSGAHHARIEAKTDAVLAATERQIAALRELKHTAVAIAVALIVAGYVIVKVL